MVAEEGAEVGGGTVGTTVTTTTTPSATTTPSPPANTGAAGAEEADHPGTTTTTTTGTTTTTTGAGAAASSSPRGAENPSTDPKENADAPEEEGPEEEGPTIPPSDTKNDEEAPGSGLQHGGRLEKKKKDDPNKPPRPPTIKDTIVVYVEMGVTGDMGVAMQRTRTKRLAKIKKYEDALRRWRRLQRGRGGQRQDDSDAEEGQEEGPPKKKKSKTDGHNDDEGSGEDDDDRPPPPPLGAGTTGIPTRDQFGGVLDYLEAKYVRGVMVDDIDERLRAKKRKKKKKRKRSSASGGDGAAPGPGPGEEEDLGDEESDEEDDGASDEEEGEGSCYSDDSFLDDSLLRTSVAQQVRASSALGGETRIEAESRRRREVEDMEVEESDDDGFFVNVGDLEVEGGYDSAEGEGDGEEEGGDHKQQQQRRPRPTPSSSSSKKGSMVKSSKKKKAKSSSSAKKLPTKAKPSASTPKVAVGKKKHDKGSIGGKASIGSGKKKKHHPQPPAATRSVSDDDEDADAFSASVDGSEQLSQSHRPSAVRSSSSSSGLSKEDKKAVAALRETSKELEKEHRRLYRKMVREIHGMTEEDLPRKKKKKMEIIRMKVVVPDKKKPGDIITFQNPRQPGQKLKVSIPEKKAPGEKFFVNVPAPDLSSSYPEENSITREARVVLEEYSRAYDDWIDNEAKIKEYFPEGKYYKPNNEKLKKFDELVKEFPSDLATPIDVTFLRKVVRRCRQNMQKKMKAAAASGVVLSSARPRLADDEEPDVVGSSTAAVGEEPPPTIDVRVPASGRHFPTVQFDRKNFARG